jgi:protein-L-isoaspartate(D-aspartate) O-methyltransferase
MSAREKIVHIGAGTGYYTAILAELTGKSGTVLAYEIEQDLAQRAATNLSSWTNVSVIHQSGSDGTLPVSDVVYVSAGATHVLDTWLDALRPNGRLLFPLTPTEVPMVRLLRWNASGDAPWGDQIQCKIYLFCCVYTLHRYA